MHELESVKTTVWKLNILTLFQTTICPVYRCPSFPSVEHNCKKATRSFIYRGSNRQVFGFSAASTNLNVGPNEQIASETALTF